jgi:AraC-like DNA-binding protein
VAAWKRVNEDDIDGIVFKSEARAEIRAALQIAHQLDFEKRSHFRNKFKKLF